MLRRSWLLILISVFCATAFTFTPVQAAKVKKPAKSIKTLEQEMREGLEYKRMLVIESLARRKSPLALEMIINAMLHDKSKPVRRAAQRVLAEREDPIIADRIWEGLQHKDRKVRLAAIDVAGLVNDPQTAYRLMQTAQIYPKDNELVRLVLESVREMVYRVEPAADFETMFDPFLKHRNKKIRLTSVIILSILARPNSLEPLMAMWDKADKKTKLHLADAFANIGRIAPKDLLLAALDTRYKPLLMHSLYALAQIQSFSALEKIHEVLQKHKDARVRMAALFALVEIPDKTSIPVIMKILADEDPSVLHWAVYALSQLEAKSAAAELMQKLQHIASLVRSSAATALGELKISGAEESLLKIVANQTEEAEVKIAAARALVKLKSKTAPILLRQCLQNDKLNMSTRLTYALAIGTLGDAKISAEVPRYLHDSNFSKSFTAALILGVQGDAQGRSILIQALEHGYPVIRHYAILGLEKIQDQESLHALANTANDDRDPIVRILCSASLVDAGFPDFRVFLWNALETRKEDIRSEAIIALGRGADQSVLQQLKWYVKREPSIPVRQTIWRVFRDLKK